MTDEEKGGKMSNLKKLTKKAELLDWMFKKRYFSTHEVVAWGLQNKYIRADRTKRDFLEQGLIRKIDDKEKKIRGFKCKDGVYTINS